MQEPFIIARTDTHTHNDTIALSCKCSANAGTFYHCTNRSIALFYKCRNLSIEPFFTRSPLHVTNAVSYKMQEPAPFFTLYTHNRTKYHTHAHMHTHTIHNTQAASSPFHLVTSFLNLRNVRSGYLPTPSART